MGEILGQSVVIDNRPGASSIIGATAVARAPADGYTFLLGDMGTYSTNRSLFKKLSYDSFTDLAPITLTARFGLMLVVHPSLPVKTLQEFIALAKSRPDTLSYGTPGTGTPHHLAMEMLMRRTGIKLTHVPYKGGGPAMQDLVGGQISVLMSDLATASQFIKTDKVRPIASTGAARLQLAPQVPTMAESGVSGFDAWAWQGFAAPAGTPERIIAALNEAYAKAATHASVKQRLADLGGELIPSSPQEMNTHMRREAKVWAQIVQESGISLD
ncbi:Bug family tripartite tricarboxylate transporter substrate binding protein [Diaphorobacter aerolatus]|nr:tripartite tricarboxylate transporter substrate binding protein [Diaphorobacter aerolatus]